MWSDSVSHRSAAGGGWLGLSGAVFNRFAVALRLFLVFFGVCFASYVGLSAFWCGRYLTFSR